MTIRSKTLQPKDWAAKAPDYIREAKLMDISIRPPSINKSHYDFLIRDDEIYFGFNAIRGIGVGAAKMIIRARQKTPFQNVYDLLNRINLSKFNTGKFQSLVLAGCFDNLGYNRLSLYHNTTALYDYVKGVPEYEERLVEKKQRDEENAEKTILIEERDLLRKELKKLERKLKKDPNSVEIQLEIDKVEEDLLPYEEMKLRRLPALRERAMPEKPEIERARNVRLTLPEIIAQGHYIGCFIDNHPSKSIGSECHKLNDVWLGQRVRVCVAISSIKEITTSRGKKMAFLGVDDDTGAAEVVLFSSIWADTDKEKLEENRLAYIEGIVDQESDPVKLKAKRIMICEVDKIE
jgi:DNA polymerase III subunit alpha